MEEFDVFDNEYESTMSTRNKRLTNKGLGPVVPTLLGNLDRIVKLVKHSGLDGKFWKDAQDCISFVEDMLHLNRNQVVLFSVFAEHSCGQTTSSLAVVSRYIACSNLQMSSMQKDIDELAKAGFIKREKFEGPFRNEDGYRVPQDVMTAMGENKPFEPVSEYNLTQDALFERMHVYFEGDKIIPNVVDETESLMDKSPALDFVVSYKKMCADKNLSPAERFVFLSICDSMVSDWRNALTTRDMLSSCKPIMMARNMRNKLESGETVLLKDNIIECVPENGMFSASFKLSKDTSFTLFGDQYAVDERSGKGVVDYTTFSEKKLFYNPEEQSQIDRVTELLKDENFKQVQERLEQRGFRKGFACLFYGAPGTGKTETVNQLARITGRDVMVVDVSQIKDKFVGESEKNIKSAFRRYADLVKNSEKAPILLFNEADAVLGIRTEGAQRAVDKMENSIQNIILQEMENLEGIMIATTNLTQNLDKAFERRFIYKIEFKKPSEEAKRNIWKSMIPTMDDQLAARLAKDYDFSGGQIENIVRKASVNFILTGEDATEDDYVELCECEIINKKDNIKKIGFNR